MVVAIQPVVDFYMDYKEHKRTPFDETTQSLYEGHLRTNYADSTYYVIEKEYKKDHK